MLKDYMLFLTIIFCSAFSDYTSVSVKRKLLENHSNTTSSEVSSISATQHGTSLKVKSTATTASPTVNQKEFHQVAANAAITVIIVVVLCIILLMAVYFIRKFDQLNRMVPSYRYSSLKTEINGVLGSDDKVESQALVNASTEEEDDFDDEDDMPSPPTLRVQSQTTVSSNKSDNSVSLQNHTIPKLLVTAEDIKGIMTVDSDDELLQ